jgi:hypothetical protein
MIEDLQKKYPRFTIRSLPVSDCKNCKGNGEYYSKAKIWQPCLCVCIGGDDEIRSIAAEALHKKVPQILRE